MNTAVYRLLDDGDYDFVAAFANDQLPPAPSKWAGMKASVLAGN